MSRFGFNIFSAVLCSAAILIAFLNILQMFRAKTQYEIKPGESTKKVYLAVNGDVMVDIRKTKEEELDQHKQVVFKINRKRKQPEDAINGIRNAPVSTTQKTEGTPRKQEKEEPMPNQQQDVVNDQDKAIHQALLVKQPENINYRITNAPLSTAHKAEETLKKREKEEFMLKKEQGNVKGWANNQDSVVDPSELVPSVGSKETARSGQSIFQSKTHTTINTPSQTTDTITTKSSPETAITASKMTSTTIATENPSTIQSTPGTITIPSKQTSKIPSTIYTDNPTSNNPSTVNNKILTSNNSRQSTTTSSTKKPTSSTQSTKKSVNEFKQNIENSHSTKIISSNQRGSSNNQQCVIPNLNPFHPDILKYITYKWTTQCNIHQFSKVDGNGYLRLKLKNVQRAGFYYIKRVNDFNVALSEWHALKDDKYTRLTAGSSGCLRVFQDNLAVWIINNNGQKILSTKISEDLNCDDANKVKLTDDNNILLLSDTLLCLSVDKDNILKFSNSSCTSEESKFHVLDGGLIQHGSSKQCLHHQHPNKFTIQNCNIESTRFYLQPMKENAFSDIDISVKLKDDFVRLDLTYDFRSKVEYHMFPVPNVSERNDINKDRKEEQLNVIMLMVDSLSRASAQRYINKTYGMLERDANSVIMKGHTINGDGTTAQLCTMFAGKQEHDLPEARRGYPNSKAVDRWNFIFNDFHKNNYVTLYSEDEPIYNAFHYRLHGFNKPPTAKYLRPWWMAADRMISEANAHSRACSHKFSFAYLKNFLNVYKTKASFSLMISSALTHAESTRATLIDDDIVDFFAWLKQNGYSNNSIVVLFGDHGNRASEFRSSLQGKLEERLPLMTFTFPPWFKEKYQNEFKNIKENSEVLTTHYDVHATLKHILNFPKMNFSHPFAKSLFSDIARLNRSCSNAGIDEHWCPCLTYTNVNTSDSVAQTLATSVVQNINKRLQQFPDSKTSCAPLQLASVHRAGKKLPNAQVQQYERTFRNERCDNCGVELNKEFKPILVSYEIVFEVLPSHGLFEATADIDMKLNEITVNDQISRINLYGDQPRCIADKYPYLRSFCYCKD